MSIALFSLSLGLFVSVIPTRAVGYIGISNYPGIELETVLYFAW